MNLQRVVDLQSTRTLGVAPSDPFTPTGLASSRSVGLQGDLKNFLSSKGILDDQEDTSGAGQEVKPDPTYSGLFADSVEVKHPISSTWIPLKDLPTGLGHEGVEMLNALRIPGFFEADTSKKPEDSEVELQLFTTQGGTLFLLHRGTLCEMRSLQIR